MGTLVGHVAPGLGFLLIGLWHLFNHIKLYTINQNSYITLSWFPPFSPLTKHLELYFLISSCSTFILTELFIAPVHHQPLASDGTIPTNHLHNFEHSSIAIIIFVYAFLAFILDKLKPPSHQTLTQFLAGTAFAQELLLFHFHSTDHNGVEGQYHKLLQLIVLVSLITTFMSIGYPKSFIVSFVRSLSIVFQGLWLIVMGFMLWTPNFISKGCFINLEEGHRVVRCDNGEALHRAKSLVNIQFSWYFIGVIIFAVLFYLLLVKIYEEKVEYQPLMNKLEDEESIDIEAQKKVIELQEIDNYTHGQIFRIN